MIRIHTSIKLLPSDRRFISQNNDKISHIKLLPSTPQQLTYRPNLPMRVCLEIHLRAQIHQISTHTLNQIPWFSFQHPKSNKKPQSSTYPVLHLKQPPHHSEEPTPGEQNHSTYKHQQSKQQKHNIIKPNRRPQQPKQQEQNSKHAASSIQQTPNRTN